MNRKDRRAGRMSSPAAGRTAPPVGAAFAAALAAHQAGRLPEAEQLYAQVLAAEPRHGATLRNLGILGLQTGRDAMAAEALEKALAVEPSVAEAHYNRAVALERLRRLPEAMTHYRQAAALRPDYADAHMNLGNALAAAGRSEEAADCYRRVVALQPGSAQARCNLANVLARAGAAEAAAAEYRHALALAPGLGEAHVGLGAALASLGRAGEAREHFQRALALDPGAADARVNLANLLSSAGETAAAMAELRAALAVRPDHARAHNNLGTLLLHQGDAAAAAQHFRRAVACEPGLAEGYNNLGLAHLAAAETGAAEQCFRRAVSLRPDFVEAWENLARLALGADQPAAALDLLRRALAIRETPETKTLIVSCLRGAAGGGEEVRDLVVRAIQEPWAQPDDVSPAAARLLLREPAVARMLAHVSAAWPARLVDPLEADHATVAAVLSDPLLRLVLESARILDPDLERLLTALRFAFLAGGAEAFATFGEAAIAFCCALGRQCFNNEYAFTLSEPEAAQAHDLRERIAAALAHGDAIAEPDLALLACYVPLHDLAQAGRLLERPWSDPVAGLLAVQVAAVAAERAERAAIPAVTAIEDAVSREVQAQYEESPYPRWGKSPATAAQTTLSQYLRAQFPTAAFDPPGRGAAIDILVAGCGTNHAVMLAQRFPAAQVLGVDLSLTSLAYSQYKARALGLANIDHAQADILKLRTLDRRFDLIEASGVLHHLADPFRGWRVLIDLLRPGGLMQVALYSEIARRRLAPARDFIAARGYAATPDDIRRFRADLMNAHEPALSGFATIADFYSINCCRDALFHVQEHRLTLPAIQEFLAASGLRFIGFELEPRVRRLYAARFPHDRSLTDLAAWHRFESENPDTFLGMYQFWVQKP